MSVFHADENRTRDVSRSAQTEALARPTSSAAQIPFSLATRIDTTHFDNPSAPCMLCVDAPRGIGQSKSHGTGKKPSCAHVICRAKKDKKKSQSIGVARLFSHSHHKCVPAALKDASAKDLHPAFQVSPWRWCPPSPRATSHPSTIHLHCPQSTSRAVRGAHGPWISPFWIMHIWRLASIKTVHKPLKLIWGTTG